MGQQGWQGQGQHPQGQPPQQGSQGQGPHLQGQQGWQGQGWRGQGPPVPAQRRKVALLVTLSIFFTFGWLYFLYARGRRRSAMRRFDQIAPFAR